MSDLFGEAAANLCGLSARTLGWRPAEFWHATPAELMLALREPSRDSESLSRDDLNRLLEADCDG